MIDQLKVEKKDDDSSLTESDDQIDKLDSLVPDNAGNSSSMQMVGLNKVKNFDESQTKDPQLDSKLFDDKSGLKM